VANGFSATEFALDLKVFGKVTEEEALLIIRKITLELDQAVVLATPVDTGRARGNWYPSINAPSTAVDFGASDKSGSQAISAAQGVIASMRLGDTVWLTNNLPYILPLENGHSKQAPQGMVDINLEAIAAHYGGSIVRT
jgi:hypothetical protein